MPSKVIGIISYLPDDPEVRERRFSKLTALVGNCRYLFGLPIHVITQNHTESERNALWSISGVTVSEDLPRLGIVGARNALREWFLGSGYDCLIMLDDDCELKGSIASAKEYLSYIDANEGCFFEFRGTLLKLFAIYRHPFDEVGFDGPSPEDGEGFEDTVFVKRLEKEFPNLKKVPPRGNLNESSLSSNDPDSTWMDGQDIKRMLDNTRRICDGMC